MAFESGKQANNIHELELSDFSNHLILVSFLRRFWLIINVLVKLHKLMACARFIFLFFCFSLQESNYFRFFPMNGFCFDYRTTCHFKIIVFLQIVFDVLFKIITTLQISIESCESNAYSSIED